MTEQPSQSSDVTQFVLSPGLRCQRLSVGSMDNNCYVLFDDQDICLLIDAAAEAGRILNLLGGRPLPTIVTTHSHRDHTTALAEVVSATGAEVVCGSPDRAAIESAAGVPCRGVWTGDRVPFSGRGLEVIGLVGHTPGSIALVVDGDPVHVFSGDALFPGGPGKTANQQDFASLMADLEARVFDIYPDATVVHPGHGKPTTLGAERPHIPEWYARGW